MIVVFRKEVFSYFEALLRRHLNLRDINLTSLDVVSFQLDFGVCEAFIHRKVPKLLIRLVRVEEPGMLPFIRMFPSA